MPTTVGPTEPATHHGPRAADSHAALVFSGISKTFGATRALDDVSFEVPQGSIHALLGGNGSGKSTLIKILAGVQRADTGSIVVNGAREAATATNPHWAHHAGLRFVHQDIAVFPTLSVAENISLGQGYARRRDGLIAWSQVRDRARDQLRRFQIAADPDDHIGMLRPADRTMVAIARALGDVERIGHVVLVLDEPTSALPETEVDRLLSLLRGYTEMGATTMFVTHRLEEALSVASNITVLRDGRHSATLAASTLTRRRLVELITGHDHQDTDDGRRQEPSPDSVVGVRLRVQDVSTGPLSSVSFDVAHGEIVGVAGLLGSGRSRLLRCIAGVERPRAGSFELDGRPIEPWPQRRAIRAGVAYLTESRQDAVFSGASVAENLDMARLSLRPAYARFSPRQVASEARRISSEYSIKAGRMSDDILTLSGGNQQKVLLARLLATNPKLLLLDEPTEGVDVGARDALHRLVRNAAAEGTSVVCASSDFDELAQLCDRVIVVGGSTITAQLRGDALDARAISRAVHAAGAPS